MCGVRVWSVMHATRAAQRGLTWAFGRTGATPNMKTTAFIATIAMTILLAGVVSAQQKPTTGYAPVNGLKIYYEIHGEGEPVVLLHGAFMTITSNWTAPWGNGTTNWIAELSKTRKVIAVEMQGHGRTADIDRDISPENLADDVSALLDHLKIPSADIIGYSLGGGAAMQCAIRHPEKVGKVVIISFAFRSDGWVKEKNDAMPKITAEAFKGSPIETEYKNLSPTPDKFADFVNHLKASAVKPYDFGADKFKATKRRCSSSTAMPTAYGSTTFRKCSASKGATSPATWGRAQHRDWPYCLTQHTSR